MDNSAAKKFEVVSGGWYLLTPAPGGCYGTNFDYTGATAGGETARARWSCTTLPPGTYQVYAWWRAYVDRSKSVPYVIMDGSTILDTRRADQTRNGNQWNLLGTYTFGSAQLVVEVHNGQTQSSSSEQYVIADAVRFVSRP